MADSLPRRAVSYYRNHGFFPLLNVSYRKAVKTILFKTPREENGIRWSPHALSPHVYFESWLPWYPPEKPGDKQWGEIYGHRNYTHPTDDVVVVGGGHGISAVSAAMEVGANGHVHVYEPSQRHVGIIEETATLNDVSDRITIHQNSVGPELGVAGSTDGARNILPEELPACDVLELDCEGAEWEILDGIDIRPRMIIVEVHNSPSRDGEALVSQIKNHGYKISECTANGKTVSRAELTEIFERRLNGSPDDEDWYKPPKIIAEWDVK